MPCSGFVPEGRAVSNQIEKPSPQKMDCIRDGIHGSSRLGSASSSRPRPNGPESDRSGLLNQTQLSLYTKRR